MEDDSAPPARIRPYEGHDQASILELNRLALEPTGAYLGSGPWDADLLDPDTVYRRAGGLFLVADLAGRVVAMGAVRLGAKDAAGTGRVTRMRVLPDLQHRGLGRRILAALEAHAAQAGVRRLVLDTTSLQTAALHLYDGAGYRETGRHRVRQLEVIDLEKDLEQVGPLSEHKR